MESLLKNLGGLVRGSKLDIEVDKSGALGTKAGEECTLGGGKDDKLLEVVASQLVNNTHELFGIVSEMKKTVEMGDFETFHRHCIDRRTELKGVTKTTKVEVEKLKEDLKNLLHELESNYDR